MSALRKTPEAVGRRQGELSAKLGRVTRKLANLNRELASQMVLLAEQTGDTRPLLGAVQALRRVKDSYTDENAPRDTAEINAELAAALFALGRANDDVEALEHSIGAYRSAITLYSLLGDEVWRRDLRRDYEAAQDALQARLAHAA